MKYLMVHVQEIYKILFKHQTTLKYSPNLVLNSEFLNSLKGTLYGFKTLIPVVVKIFIGFPVINEDLPALPLRCYGTKIEGGKLGKHPTNGAHS